tara:strand:- start:5574 stop:5978 length:405 start_codon:yes stop_codon:yes gene_type:complete
MLDALERSQGEYRAAAKELKISEATFSAWVVQLRLIEDASRIRRHFGLPSAYNESQLELKSEGDSVSISNSVIGNCTSCHKEMTELVEPVSFLGINNDRTGKNRGKMFIVVRSGDRTVHWYLLDEVKMDDINSD